MRLGRWAKMMTPGFLWTWLGRNFDEDAEAYFRAAKISWPLERVAANRLIVALKKEGLWVKLSRLYLVSTQSYNASLYCAKTRNPLVVQPSDTAPGWDETGWTFNGGDQLFLTDLRPNQDSIFQINSNHSLVFLTEGLLNPSDLFYLFGAATSTRVVRGQIQDNLSTGAYSILQKQTTSFNLPNYPSLTGCYSHSRTSTTSLKSYFNGLQQSQSTTSTLSSEVGTPIMIGASNTGVQSFPSGEWGANQSDVPAEPIKMVAVTFGGGLTDDEMFKLYELIYIYNFELRRFLVI